MPPLSVEIWRAIAAANSPADRSYLPIRRSNRAWPSLATASGHAEPAEAGQVPSEVSFCAPLDEPVPGHAKGSLTSNR